MIKKCCLGKCRYFSRLWQQGLNFANSPILGSCTHSLPEAPDARVKYVAHTASCYKQSTTVKKMIADGCQIPRLGNTRDDGNVDFRSF